MPKQQRRTFTAEFKKQMVELFENGVREPDELPEPRLLELELYDYVNWFNKHRIHGTLGYMTPVQYRDATLKKVV